MKIIKKIIIVLAILFAIPLVVALFTKSDYAVERNIEINIAKQEAFDYIKSLKNQEKFSVWSQRDLNMKRTYTGTDGTVGFVAGWESDNEEVGVGEQEIIKIADGERVDFELRFIKPFEAVEPAFMTTEAINETTTKVTWGFNGHMDYPINLMLLFMDFETMIGNDLQEGLDKLKVVLED